MAVLTVPVAHYNMESTALGSGLGGGSSSIRRRPSTRKDAWQWPRGDDSIARSNGCLRRTVLSGHTGRERPSWGTSSPSMSRRGGEHCTISIARWRRRLPSQTMLQHDGETNIGEGNTLRLRPPSWRYDTLTHSTPTHESR